MTHPGAPRDVDLDAWRDKFAFHPADTKAKQLGHQLTRKAVMALAELLHWLVPPSDDKSVMFRLLGDVLMLANRSLATQGGPRLVEGGGEEYLEIVLASALRSYEKTALPEDPRIAEYEAQQRGEALPAHGLAERDGQLVQGLTGAVVTEAAEPGIAGEKDSEDAETFAWEFEDGDVTLKVVGGRNGIAVATTGPIPPPVENDDARSYGWFANLSSPTQVNELLSAIAVAGDRAFTQRP
jgi:hypothetical protein